MKTRIFTTGMGLLAVTLVSLVGTNNVFAGPVVPLQIQPRPYLRPQLPPVIGYPTPVIPRLGFMGHVQYGFGMVVDSVSYGGFASRLGLEPGDMIVRINNHPISNDSSYNRAVLSSVEYQGGFLDLVVVDVRTGIAQHRAGYLNYGNGGSGPILPRALPHVHANVGYGF